MIFEEFRVDSSWLLANLQNKNTCLFFKTTLHNTFKTTFKNIENFSKDKYTFVYIPTWIITKVATILASFQNIFKSTHTKHHFKQLKNKASDLSK